MHRISKIGKESLRHWKEITLIYIVQLILGIIVGMVFYFELSQHVNQSMVLDQLAQGFDRTVMMDMMNATDHFLSWTKTTAVSFLLIYIFTGAFLQAGWLANIRGNQYQLTSLLSSGKKYYFPFLSFAFFAFLGIAMVGGLMIILFTSIVGDPLVTFSSEKPYVIWIICLLILFIFWLITIWAWSVLTRFFYIDGNSFFKSIRLGWSSLQKQWYKFQAIGFLILGIHVLLMFVYYWIMEDRGAPSWGIVILCIIVQQLFNYIRIVLRGFGYGLIEDLV